MIQTLTDKWRLTTRESPDVIIGCRRPDARTAQANDVQSPTLERSAGIVIFGSMTEFQANDTLLSAKILPFPF